MIRSLIRCAPHVLACAALLHGAAAHAQGTPVQVIIPIQVQGADAACSSFSLGGTASAPTLICNPISGPAPFGCSLSGAPSGTIAPGTAVNLSMNCNNGTPPYTYSWNTGSTAQALPTQNPTATTTYSVTAKDSAQPQASVVKSATVNVSTGGGGGGGGTISCAGFSNTTEVPLTWIAAAAATVSYSETEAIVVSFTAGSTTHFSQVTAVDVNTPGSRLAVLSTSPCDFAYQPPTLGINAVQAGTSVTQRMAVSPLTSSSRVQLVAGTKYYWNIATNANTCGGGCVTRVVLTP